MTTDGSVTVTRAIYEELFWGREPLPMLMRARAKLHADYGHTHDWASVVVYDGLPDDLPTQALACRYERAKRALGHAQGVIRGLTKNTRIEEPVILANHALELLPNSGGYERERQGLIASHAKLMAEDSHRKGTAESKPNTPQRELFIQARAYLEQARRHYYNAARGFLDPGNAKQLQATLHWVLTQAISLDRLVGDSGADLGWSDAHVEAFKTTPEQQAWDLAFQSATVAAQGKIDVWGHGTLAELWLLKLFEKLPPGGIERAKALAEQHATRMAQLSVGADPFPVYSTKRQINRYAELWTEEFRRELELVELGPEQQGCWENVRKTAKGIVALLTRFDTKPGD